MESRANLNGVKDQVFVLPCNIEPSEADVLSQSATFTAPPCEGNKSKNGIKLRIRNRLYKCIREAEDLERKRVGPDNRMLWVVLGEQALAT